MIIFRHRHGKRYSRVTIAEGASDRGASRRLREDGKWEYTASRTIRLGDVNFQVILTEGELEALYSEFRKAQAKWVRGDKSAAELREQMLAEEKSSL